MTAQAFIDSAGDEGLEVGGLTILRTSTYAKDTRGYAAYIGLDCKCGHCGSNVYDEEPVNRDQLAAMRDFFDEPIFEYDLEVKEVAGA